MDEARRSRESVIDAAMLQDLTDWIAAANASRGEDPVDSISGSGSGRVLDAGTGRGGTDAGSGRAVLLERRLAAGALLVNALESLAAGDALELRELRRAQAIAEGHDGDRAATAACAEVALARRESPRLASSLAQLAAVSVEEMPRLADCFARGEVTRWRMSLMLKATAALSPELRARLDSDLSADDGHGARIGRMSSRQIGEIARTAAAALAPQDMAAVVAQERAGRRVSLRSGPGSMARLSAVLPMEVGVAIRSALHKASLAVRATGDQRTLEQVGADVLAARALGGPALPLDPAAIAAAWPHLVPVDTGTGTAGRLDTSHSAEASNGTNLDSNGAAVGSSDGTDAAAADMVPPAPESGVPPLRNRVLQRPSITWAESDMLRPENQARDAALIAASHPRVAVQVHVVMTDRSLFGDTDTPARLLDAGPVPAAIARELIARASADDLAKLRRLWQDPQTHELISMDSRARRFPAAAKLFFKIRDEHCVVPICGGSVTEADHRIPVHEGGETSLANGQGICRTHNNAKEHPGWSVSRGLDGTTTVTTPTGRSVTGITTPLPHDPDPRDTPFLGEEQDLQPLQRESARASEAGESPKPREPGRSTVTTVLTEAGPPPRSDAQAPPPLLLPVVRPRSADRETALESALRFRPGPVPPVTIDPSLLTRPA